ncbi:MAG: hypothetical protein ABJ251_06985 [Paracoccaceae bacterium]
MTELSEEARRALIGELLEKKIGNCLHWQKPKAGYCVGPSNLAVYDKFLATRDSLVERAVAELQVLTDQQLGTIKSPQIENDDALIGWWALFLRYEIPNVSTDLPPPLAFGFGHPSFQADFNYWAQMATLSLEEFLALSVGADPGQITEQRIASWTPKKFQQNPPKKLWPAQAFLLKRKEQLIRYFHNTGWGYTPMPLRDVKALIDEIELDVHPEFYNAVEKRLTKQAAKPKGQKSNNLTNIERQSLLKMIAGMAFEAYKFDPQASRNNATSEIQADVESIGQSIDPKTILKWLKEAGELVHEDFWKGRRD